MDGTTGIDLVTTLINPIQEGINSSLSGALPVVAAVASVMIGIGIVLKLVKKCTK